MSSSAHICNSGGAATLPLITKANSKSDVEESLKTLFSGSMPGLLPEVVLHALKDPIVMIDYDLRILWANQASTKSWAIGKLCYEEFQGKGEPCTRCPVKAIFNSGRGGVEEKWISFANGSGRWFEVRTYPISDQKGKILCAFKICFDVTHRRHTLEKQKNYIETLERTLKQIRHSISRTNTEPRDSTDRNTRLSRREMEVLKLVTEGFTNSQVSQILSISAHTVKSHMINIFNKLGVSDRTQAAVQAIRLGII